MSGIGKEVKRLRKEKDWTQEQLAVYAGSSQPTINQIESGVRNPSTRTLEKIAAALDVEVRDLFPLGQAPLPLEGARRSEAEGGAVATATVVHAIDTMIGLRVIAREYLLEWAKELDRFRETHTAPEEGTREEMFIIADSLQDQFIESFAAIAEAARAEGRDAPHEWPRNIKDVVYEAGARVQAATEVAMRVSEEGAALDDDFSIGTMPGELTTDPAWNQALEEARAVR